MLDEGVCFFVFNCCVFECLFKTDVFRKYVVIFVPSMYVFVEYDCLETLKYVSKKKSQNTYPWMKLGGTVFNCGV